MGNDISYIDLRDSPVEWRELLRVWRNKPRVRSEMARQEEISPAEHAVWLKKVLSTGENDKIRIAVLGGVPFGIVRLMDINGADFSSDWGLYIGEERFLGCGFGKKMLAYLIKWAFTEEELKELHTKVHKKNAKALSIYKSFGFYVTGETGDFYTMSLKSDGETNETKIWTIGHGGNGRDMPLEIKRKFTLLFTTGHLPKCIDNGAVIEIKSDSDDVYLKWRGITFKINSYIDLGIFVGKMPSADVVIPPILPGNCDWGYITFDTKNDMGFSALHAASKGEFKKIITFCEISENFALNESHSKIEILPQELSGNIDELRSKFDNLPVFAAFSLTGAENTPELAENIKNCDYIKGISVINDLPDSEKDLPAKIVAIMQDSRFKGSAQDKVFVGYRE